MKKQDNIKAAHYCFFINNKVKKITLMSTKTNKQIKKKRKENNGERDSFIKFKMKAAQMFAYL